MRRALRWDGILCQTGALDDIGTIAARVDTARPGDLAGGRFDIVVQGSLPLDDPAKALSIADSYADAGATWWVDADWDDATVGANRRRIRAGPPAPAA